MNIFFENVNFNSRSGPNSFGKKLSEEFIKNGHNIVLGIPESVPDVQLSFIMSSIKVSPMVQRLDGIYFNSEQDFNSLNEPIESTYLAADSVIFQSNFNRDLTFHYFGKKDDHQIVSNGTNLEIINGIPALDSDVLNSFNEVWCCASSWRPHKRLKENIKYFMDTAPQDVCLIIAGSNPDVMIADPRIFYAGDLDWVTLISLYKRASKFLHLAWLDHCPNVVIDARAAGCHIVCSSAGGTKEIAGKNSTIILEDEWDFSPIKLYNPPEMDFSKTIDCKYESEIDIKEVYKSYLSVLERIRNKNNVS
jgi:glycosyltransferase involved in cell wall biosynthesis